jgi:Flp pilus assembly protein TadG
VFVFALCLVAIVPVLGLAVDVTLIYMAQSKLSAATDAAVLAAARGLSRGADSSAQQTSATTTATNYINASFPTGFLGSSALTSTTTITTQSNQRTVDTTSSVTLPLMFMRWVGPSTTTVKAYATATRKDVNVMLVLDRSGSLTLSGSCTPMKAAATAFIGQFAATRDNVGLLTFATGYRIDSPLSTNFLSGSPSITTTIGSIICTGATNSSTALSKAYEALATLNQPSALNVILFFTDGQPTHITAQNWIPSTSSCSTKNAWVPGVIGGGFNTSTWPYTPSGVSGLYSWNSGPQPLAADTAVITNSGCSFNSSVWNVDNDVDNVKSTDYFGNAINNNYTTVSYDGSGNVNFNSQNMMNIATNATYSAAKTIQQGGNSPAGNALSNVYIFSIGLGNAGFPANANLLKDVSNDPTAPNYNSTYPAGFYIAAATTADLNPAFQRVASEVLRLAR